MHKNEKLCVTTILGTRPEIIRLSQIIKLFELHFSHRLFFSSQNRQPFVGMNFFSELGLRKPDVIMQNDSTTTAEFLSKLLVEIEDELTKNRPDAVVILGDTNTSLAAIIVRKMGIPIYHLEAGNRSFDANVPEELNRKVVDHIADFNLAYSRKAESNLIDEGLDSRRCLVVGTPLREVIDTNKSKIENSDVLGRLNLKPQGYFLVSAHRQENIDNPSRLAQLYETLNTIAEKFSFPIVVTTHPRLKSMMEKSTHNFNQLINFVNPLGFIDYCNLQLNAHVVLSDSGSISEESALLGFKAITLRDSLERPEALESGSILMSGLDSRRVVSAIEFVQESKLNPLIPADYLISNTSARVMNFMLSTYHVRDFWLGLR